MKEGQDPSNTPAEENKAAKWARYIGVSLGFGLIALIMVMAIIKK